MPNVSSKQPADVCLWVALDVHKFSIVAATLPPTGGQPELSRIETTRVAIRRFIVASRTQLRDQSPEQAPRRRPRSTLDGGRADEPRSWGTQPPNMSMTTVAKPADARTAPPTATTSTTTNQAMANNPYPLTSTPSIWANDGPAPGAAFVRHGCRGMPT